MIRLLIVDRLRLMCGVMETILQSELNAKVIGVVASAQEAESRLGDCDILLVSACLPERGALRLVRAAARCPVVKTIVMDVDRDQDSAAVYMREGASDCVYEEESIEELIWKVRSVLAHGNRGNGEMLERARGRDR